MTSKGDTTIGPLPPATDRVLLIGRPPDRRVTVRQSAWRNRRSP